MFFSVGEAIDVQKVDNPTVEQIEQLHLTYEKKLVELFDTNKEKYGVDRDTQLTIYWLIAMEWNIYCTS